MQTYAYPVRPILYACLIFVLVFLPRADVRAEDFAATQAFSDIELNKTLTEKDRGFVNLQSKFQDEEPEWFRWHVKAGIRHKFNKWAVLQLAHRYQKDRFKGSWIRESRSEVQITFRKKQGPWGFSSRNRFEFRDFASPKSDTWRYRNQFKVSRSLPWEGVSIYVSEEPQYDFELKRWYKHRVTAGVKFPVCTGVTASTYYRWDIKEQKDDKHTWDKYQIFGFKLRVNLDAL
ncbi:MAG: DUF2490 domain-containing protein [Desulfuromonas sp.]